MGLPEVVEEVVQVTLLTLRLQADAAVGFVAYPAGQAVSVCELSAGGTEADALYISGESGVEFLFHATLLTLRFGEEKIHKDFKDEKDITFDVLLWNLTGKIRTTCILLHPCEPSFISLCIGML